MPRFSVRDAKPSRKRRTPMIASSPGVRWSRSGRRSSGRGTSTRMARAQSGSSVPRSFDADAAPSELADDPDRGRATDPARRTRPARCAAPSPGENPSRGRGSAGAPSRCRARGARVESPSVSRANAIRLPPGDHAGARASGNLRERLGLSAAGGDDPQLPAAGARREKAMRVPSGEHGGVDVVARPGDERVDVRAAVTADEEVGRALGPLCQTSQRPSGDQTAAGRSRATASGAAPRRCVRRRRTARSSRRAGTRRRRARHPAPRPRRCRPEAAARARRASGPRERTAAVARRGGGDDRLQRRLGLGADHPRSRPRAAAGASPRRVRQRSRVSGSGSWGRRRSATRP